MNKKYLTILILAVLFCVQFLVLPTFSSTAQGGKIAAFSLFVEALTAYMLFQYRVWRLPKVLIPLVFLFFIFSLSLFFSQWPAVGSTQLHTYAMGLIFCTLVANISDDSDSLHNWIFAWFRVLGLIVAVLCLYQYIDWLLVGQRDTMLIHYLLPPSSSRVNGIYGQPNMTALLLLVSIIAFCRGYASNNGTGYHLKDFYLDAGLLFVALAFFLTGSRAGLLAFFVVSAVLFLLIYRSRIVFCKQSLLKIFLILLAGFFITQIPFSAEIPGTMYSRSSISTDARFLFWTASILMFIKAPFLGVGLDHFKLLLPSYSLQAHDFLGFVQYEVMGYTRWSHNEYLQVLAEAGIVGFIFLITFCVLLARIMFVEVSKGRPDNKKLFIFLMLLPFFVQGMFSWPFRHPALLFIFFLILGIAVAETSSVKFKVTNSAKLILSCFLMASVAMVVMCSFKEYQFVKLTNVIRDDGCKNDKIFSLIDDPYLEFKILSKVLPLCLADESFLAESSLVERYKPYFLKIVDLQGTYSQWYNLGLVHRALGEHVKAKAALQKAVERQPVFEQGWLVLHALNIEEATRKTGRPIQDFLPLKNNSSVDFDNLFSK